jgi:hypothetical protein
MILLGLGIGAVFWDGPPTVGQVQVLDGFLRHVVARNPSDVRQLKRLCDEMIRLEGPRSEAVLQSLAVAHGRWLSRPVQHLGIRDMTARDQSPENVALWLYHLVGSESGGMTREKLARLIVLCRGLGVDGEQMLQRFRQVPHLSTAALEALGLARGADFKEVKRRYRDLQRKLHPDRRNGEPGEGYHGIQEAYELLSWQTDLPN